MTVTLRHPEGSVRVERLADGRAVLSVEMADPRAFVATREWTTSYPDSLIERILRLKGPDYLCDEIRREEDPTYVERQVRYGILGYVAPEAFRGKRLLDFGCGAGSSLMALARLLPPEVEMVGVELEEEALEVARARAEHYRVANLELLLSPGGSELPPGLGTFDFITMNAVYEHLLPAERRTLLPLLWSHLADGGVLFVNQTPSRHFPLEWHTTGLPLLNYLPARLALAVARVASPRVGRRESWESLLRRGIRGGSVGEVMGDLPRQGAGQEAGQSTGESAGQGSGESPRRGVDPVLLEPADPAVRDRIDLWHRSMEARGAGRGVTVFRGLFKVIRAVTGITLLPTLSIALRKGGG